MSGLKNIKVSEDVDEEKAKLILKYINYFATKSVTSDLRTHWTFIYKWVSKYLRRK